LVQLIVVVDPDSVWREELDPSNPFGGKLETIVMIQHFKYIYFQDFAKPMLQAKSLDDHNKV